MVAGLAGGEGEGDRCCDAGGVVGSIRPVGAGADVQATDIRRSIANRDAARGCRKVTPSRYRASDGRRRLTFAQT
jgi:hypothetical protein